MVLQTRNKRVPYRLIGETIRGAGPNGGGCEPGAGATPASLTRLHRITGKLRSARVDAEEEVGERLARDAEAQTLVEILRARVHL